LLARQGIHWFQCQWTLENSQRRQLRPSLKKILKASEFNIRTV
jgi:hypothetical protein